MSEGLSDGGEETYNKSGVDGLGLNLYLYSDSTDNIGDSATSAGAGDNATGAMTTEPTDGNYTSTPVSHTIATGEIVQDGSGNWGFQFTETFDVTGTTGSVDAVLLEDSSDSTIFARHLLDGGSITLDAIDSLDVTVEGYLD